MSIKKINIWDLDGTVINSFHRVEPCLKENGDLDLNKYKAEACTHEKIQADTLLPLVEVMRQKLNAPDELNVIVTARLLSKSDYYYLRKQGLRSGRGYGVEVFSRDTLAKHFPHAQVKGLYNSGDAKYKRAYFELLMQRYPDALMTVFDDHQGVLQTARDLGLQAVDATMLNDLLDIGFRLGMQSAVESFEDDELDISYLQEKINFLWDCQTDEQKENLSVRAA